MIPVKFWIGLIAAILLSVGGTLFSQHYLHLVKQAELADARKDTAINTTATVEDGEAADANTAKVEVVLSDTRETFKQDQHKAKANEPETAQRANRVVPVSVRNNFKQRRLARERSGCVPGECTARDAPADATQR